MVLLLVGSHSVLAEDEDLNGNGLADAYEQQFVNMYCPSLVLHPGDGGVSPEPVEIITGQMWGTILMYNGGQYAGEHLFSGFSNTSQDYSMYDNERIDPPTTLIDGTVENCGDGIAHGQNLVKYHFDYGGRGKGECDWQSRDGYDQPTQQTGPDWQKIYAQGVEWTSSAGTTYRTEPGSYYPNTVYAHPFHFIDPATQQYVQVIQYWFFYPFDDWVNNHEGDWEHINVILDSNRLGATVRRVVYYFHETYVIASDTQAEFPDGPFDCYVEVDAATGLRTHPVVFVGGRWSACKDYGPGLQECGAGQGSHGSYPMPGAWSETTPAHYYDVLEPGGLYIPYHQIVDNDSSYPDKTGVVLINHPDSYPYSTSFKYLSWLKADILWGRPRVWSMGSAHTTILSWLGHTELGNTAPQGPYHQATWELPYGQTSLGWPPYAGTPPYERASQSGWVPPATLVSLSVPYENQNVSDVVHLIGTIHYADQVSLEYGSGPSPSSWYSTGTTIAAAPVFSAEVGTWNTGVVPSGMYTIRLTATYGGISHTVTRTVNVQHHTRTVASSGADFTDIHTAALAAEMGDVILVSADQQWYEDDTIIMKETVQLISAGGTAEVFGADGQPVVTIQDHSYPCLIRGFVFRHNYIGVDYPGGTTEHGVKITDASPTFQDCIFTGNRANRGSGARIIGNSRPVFENCWFEGNRAEIEGGAVYFDGGSGAFADCKFSANYVPASGEGGSGVSISGPPHLSVGTPSFTGCTFENNDSPGSSSSVLRLRADTEFTGSLFTGNDATYLGRITGAQPSFTNCTITGNAASTALFHRTDGIGGVSCTRCIISFSGGPFATNQIAPQATVFESIMYANAASGAGPADSNWVPFVENPTFCNAAAGNYYLLASSPAAPGAHYPQRAGAFDVACAPTAVVTVAEGDPGMADGSALVGCPAGDMDHLNIQVAFDNNVVTRPLGASELSLQPPYLAQGIVSNATITGTSSTGTVITLDHPYLSGYGVNEEVTLYLNGYPLAQKALLTRRSPDMKGTPGCSGDISCPDGKVSFGDYQWFVTHYPTGANPNAPYFAGADYYATPADVINSSDFNLFVAHYGNGSGNHKYPGPDPLLQTVGSEQTVSTHVTLAFTEEYVTALDHRLYVDVALADCADLRCCLFVLRSNRDDLTLSSWEPTAWAASSAPFAAVDTDDGQNLVFGVIMINDSDESTRQLGRLVFAVSGSDPVVIGQDEFILTAGDVELLGGQDGLAYVAGDGTTTARMSGVSGRVLNQTVQQVFHNRLEQNFPNPFNPQTTLAYSLKDASDVSLVIYDVAGRRVRELVNGHRRPGAYKVVWDGRNGNGTQVASGVYFYKLVAGSFVDTKKMIMLK